MPVPTDNGLLDSIVYELIAGGIATAIGFLIGSFREYRKTQTINRAILNLFRLRERPGSEPMIYVIHAALPRPNQPFFFLPSCDMKVVRDVGTLLEQVDRQELSDFEILTEHEVRHRTQGLNDNDFIVIGGTKANTLTGEIVKWLDGIKGLNYRMGYDETANRTTIYRVRTGEMLIASKDEPAKEQDLVQYDYGLIQSLRHPRNPQRNLVILAGIHGAGTLGISTIITNSSELSEICSKWTEEPIEILIKVYYKRSDPHTITSVERVV